MSYSSQAVEWPSLPALPTPPQPPRNSGFQGLLQSFRKVVHLLRCESHDSSAPRRDYPGSDLLQPIEQSIESLPPLPLQQLETNDRVSEPRDASSARFRTNKRFALYATTTPTFCEVHPSHSFRFVRRLRA